MEELVKLLSETIEGVDFENKESVGDETVTLEDHYDIEIDMEYMVPENFESAKAMLNMIEELQD